MFLLADRSEEYTESTAKKKKIIVQSLIAIKLSTFKTWIAIGLSRKPDWVGSMLRVHNSHRATLHAITFMVPWPSEKPNTVPANLVGTILIKPLEEVKSLFERFEPHANVLGRELRCFNDLSDEIDLIIARVDCHQSYIRENNEYA